MDIDDTLVAELGVKLVVRAELACGLDSAERSVAMISSDLQTEGD